MMKQTTALKSFAILERGALPVKHWFLIDCPQTLLDCVIMLSAKIVIALFTKKIPWPLTRSDISKTYSNIKMYILSLLLTRV